MKVSKKSYKSLVASVHLCLRLNKNIGKAAFSRLNLSILSFLCNRGFVSNFKFVKEGQAGYIAFTLRRINGALVIRSIKAPWSMKTSSPINQTSKYQNRLDLIKLFSSEFALVSTPKGLMTSLEAVDLKLGGTVLCIIT